MFLDTQREAAEASIQLLDRVKKKLGIYTDAELCVRLHISSGRMSNYRRGIRSVDDELIEKIAPLLGEPVEALVAELNAVRAKSPVLRSAYLKIAELARNGRLAKLAIAILAIGLLLPIDQAWALEIAHHGSAPASDQFIQCAQLRRRRWYQAACALGRALRTLISVFSAHRASLAVFQRKTPSGYVYA